jgi:hypothetical protein
MKRGCVTCTILELLRDFYEVFIKEVCFNGRSFNNDVKIKQISIIYYRSGNMQTVVHVITEKYI